MFLHEQYAAPSADASDRRCRPAFKVSQLTVAQHHSATPLGNLHSTQYTVQLAVVPEPAAGCWLHCAQCMASSLMATVETPRFMRTCCCCCVCPCSVNVPGTYYLLDSTGQPAAATCPADTYSPGLRKQRACVPCATGFTTNQATEQLSARACGTSATRAVCGHVVTLMIWEELGDSPTGSVVRSCALIWPE